MKKKIGITGQQGFVGSYLFNKISLLRDEFELVPFNREYFQDAGRLSDWSAQCDVIVHLAAMNRHPDAQVIYDTNVSLVRQLLDAVESSGSKPHILFSSSTQEGNDNLYGASKRLGRTILKEWSQRSGAPVTGLVIPNVFGPFGKPFYNSVVATFCHQLCNGQQPKIEVDSVVNLIYVDELAEVIIAAIRDNISNPELVVKPTTSISVSAILSKLQEYKDAYFDEGVLPLLPDMFSVNLFNTYRSYIDHAGHFPVLLKKNTDERGSFVETVRLRQGGQVSFSTTVKGVTRGNHFHTRKIERFAVIRGKALIRMRKYKGDKVLEFRMDGDQPSYVDMPVWYTHNITNTGDEDLYTIFWINEFFNPSDPDTFFETVEIYNGAIV